MLEDLNASYLKDNLDLTSFIMVWDGLPSESYEEYPILANGTTYKADFDGFLVIHSNSNAYNFHTTISSECGYFQQFNIASENNSLWTFLPVLKNSKFTINHNDMNAIKFIRLYKIEEFQSKYRNKGN